ncbi:asparagine synthase (glutamine-hydrolyzing) [Bacillus sp. DJP31]|uniref:asparagine synthase (glutamine-hydrolyzing) n=1 Tax=Bacillus sp. DJP31 TaxID=3409789 RepID=UPI003BB593B3
MCGFVACLNTISDKGIDIESARIKFEDITHLISHRGPDDSGFYYDDFISMGFRRLSIIDIESGHQPLPYENNRYWILFNGEIYNYLELREELLEEGFIFNTHSDTEVILAMYSHVKEKVVDRLRGMFSFLIWDKEESVLFGARDHFGIKPLYYMENDGQLYFSSEKKSIEATFNKEMLNYKSLQHYLTYQYIPEPDTLTNGINKLSPGHFFTVKPGESMKIQAYWKPSFSPQLFKSEDQFAHDIKNVLIDSVAKHMRSDVPVGSFLSGGIDSTLIVSLAKEINPKIKTFSVGFEDNGYSEIDVAKQSAEALGLENIHHVITPEEFINELPKIVWHMDDPVADPAAIPLYFVAKKAKEHVTVVLSGEGADELFGGYNIYQEPNSLEIFKHIPGSAKRILNNLVSFLPEGTKGKSFIERGSLSLEQRFIGNAKIFNEKEKEAIYKLYNDKVHYTDITNPLYKAIESYDPITKMQFIDIHTWMRGDILVKADRMTMAHSLELRVPFLDKEVFEVASHIPSGLKVKDGATKYILRQAAKGIVPDHVLNRRKLGFPVPIRVWLKNELYDWAVQTIERSHTEHLLNKKEIIKLLDDHRVGKLDVSRKLWTILMFMVWYEVVVEDKYSFTSSNIRKFTPSLV